MSSKIQWDRSDGKLFYKTNRFISFAPVIPIIFFLSPFSTRIRVWKVFFLDFLRSYDDRKSVRGKVGVIRRGNIESKPLFSFSVQIRSNSWNEGFLFF